MRAPDGHRTRSRRFRDRPSLRRRVRRRPLPFLPCRCHPLGRERMVGTRKPDAIPHADRPLFGGAAIGHGKLLRRPARGLKRKGDHDRPCRRGDPALGRSDQPVRGAPAARRPKGRAHRDHAHRRPTPTDRRAADPGAGGGPRPPAPEEGPLRRGRRAAAGAPAPRGRGHVRHRVPRRGVRHRQRAARRAHRLHRAGPAQRRVRRPPPVLHGRALLDSRAGPVGLARHTPAGRRPRGHADRGR